MKILNYICCLLLVVTIISCNNDDDVNLSEDTVLLFGQFYGFCGGPDCIQIFKLEENQLLEDSNDVYPTDTPYNGNYTALSTAKFDLVKDLIDDFPADLLNETATTLGCPDCADQGGYYIEYGKDGNTQHWKIDTDRSNVPQYLHNFMDKIDEKIAIINN